MESGEIVAGQCPVRQAQPEPERVAVLALGQSFAAVPVEEPVLFQDGMGKFPDGPLEFLVRAIFVCQDRKIHPGTGIDRGLFVADGGVDRAGERI